MGGDIPLKSAKGHDLHAFTAPVPGPLPVSPAGPPGDNRSGAGVWNSKLFQVTLYVAKPAIAAIQTVTFYNVCL